MREFNELTEEEIFTLLSFDQKHELGIKPSLREIAESLSKYIPLELFAYYKQLVETAMPDGAPKLIPAQLNLKKLRGLNPAILQKLFNIPDSFLAYRALTALDIETQNVILGNVSKKNREGIEALRSQNLPVSDEEAKSALTAISEPLRLYLADLGYMTA